MEEELHHTITTLIADKHEWVRLSGKRKISMFVFNSTKQGDFHFKRLD
jgi:adenine deaminase